MYILGVFKLSERKAKKITNREIMKWKHLFHQIPASFTPLRIFNEIINAKPIMA
jgi:hypothetical protein